MPVHTQSTLEQIAASGNFLDIELGIECPDGEVVKAMARFDTGSNLDVIDPTQAAVTVLKKHTVHWGHEGVNGWSWQASSTLNLQLRCSCPLQLLGGNCPDCRSG